MLVTNAGHAAPEVCKAIVDQVKEIAGGTATISGTLTPEALAVWQAIFAKEAAPGANLQKNMAGGTPNPHAWMSPLNVQTYVDNMVDAFAERVDQEPETYRWSYARDFDDVRLVVVDSRAARVLTPGHRSILDDTEMAAPTNTVALTKHWERAGWGKFGTDNVAPPDQATQLRASGEAKVRPEPLVRAACAPPGAAAGAAPSPFGSSAFCQSSWSCASLATAAGSMK
mgnify:CR=1 FL=1